MVRASYSQEEYYLLISSFLNGIVVYDTVLDQLLKEHLIIDLIVNYAINYPGPAS